MTFLILTPQQADSVRGESLPGYFLEPVLLADGNYALNELVLSDPAHSAKWPLLSGLLRSESPAWLPPEE